MVCPKTVEATKALQYDRILMPKTRLFGYRPCEATRDGEPLSASSACWSFDLPALISLTSVQVSSCALPMVSKMAI